jgi:hypothetical protein
MIITKRSSPLLLLIQAIACLAGTIMIAIVQRNAMDAFWMLIILFCTYGTLMQISITYLAGFKSPEYLELNGDNLIVKLPFRDSISIKVTHIVKIDRTKILWILQRTYDIKIHLSPENIKIYLGKYVFDNLEEFLRELAKANPKCQIDQWLT